MTNATRQEQGNESVQCNGTACAGRQNVFLPATDIRETKDAFVLTIDMPGVDERSVELTVENKTLTVDGKPDVQQPERMTLAHAEYISGVYRRVFTLPDSVDRDAVQAAMKDGVLRVTLPKSGPAKAKKIVVKAE